MGWYKEYLQDLADIQAEENTRNFWMIIGAIPGCLGAFGLWMTISCFSEGAYLGSLAGLGLFVVMLLPMFICGAKSGGGIGGGIGGIILCLIVTGVLYYCIPTKAETEAKEAETEEVETGFETLKSLLKSFEGGKVKDCVGYWKGEGLRPLHISKNGKKYTMKLELEDGKRSEISATAGLKQFCHEIAPNICSYITIKELICEERGADCFVAKGDSAYYFETIPPFSYWGYVRIDKRSFDKEVKEFRKSSSK